MKNGKNGKKVKKEAEVQIVKMSPEVWTFLQHALALGGIFQLGYIPAKEEFYELTPEQYERYYETEVMEEKGEKIFMLLPGNVKKYNELASGDVFVCSEKEISMLEDLEKEIDKYCEDSGKTFETVEEKLHYLARMLPDYFTEGTKFERKRVIYLDKKKL
jgi:hypothetical protein